MFGEHPSLKILEARRRLLVAESEAHRTQLHHDLKIIHENIQLLRDEVVSVKSVVSGVATVVSAFGAMRASARNGKSSFFSKVVRGARFASTVWNTFRPQ
jgi:hypothetical protein